MVWVTFALQERQQQMGFSLAQLDKAPYGNVLFAGRCFHTLRVSLLHCLVFCGN